MVCSYWGLDPKEVSFQDDAGVDLKAMVETDCAISGDVLESAADLRSKSTNVATLLNEWPDERCKLKTNWK